MVNLVGSEIAGGSWFLFNRRVHRLFRDDGHGWRKKRGGKTIAEAHEYLKVCPRLSSRVNWRSRVDKLIIIIGMFVVRTESDWLDS